MNVTCAAAKIGIPDLLKDGPLTAKEIAKKAGTHCPPSPTYQSKYLNTSRPMLPLSGVTSCIDHDSVRNLGWLLCAVLLGMHACHDRGPGVMIKFCTGGLREDDIFRALRMLSAHGFYEALPGKNGEPTRFRNTAATSTLRTDHPNTVRYMVSPCLPHSKPL